MPTIWLRPFISASYWKQRSLGLARSYIAALGSLWLFVKVVSEVYAAATPYTSSWFLLALPLFVAIWSNMPIPFIRHKLHGRDVTIEIRVGDILELDGSMVISANTTFETSLDDDLISPQSLQAKFTKKFYDTVDRLNLDLERSLDRSEATGEPRRGRPRWPIGTVVMLKPRGKTVYMVAIAELNDHGVAQGSKEDVFASLGKLWHFIGERGELEPVCIPVLGTGRARITTVREDMVKEIVRSFIAACSERKFTERLTVVISTDDYIQHQVELDSLGNYVKHLCENPPFSRTTVLADQ